MTERANARSAKEKSAAEDVSGHAPGAMQGGRERGPGGVAARRTGGRLDEGQSPAKAKKVIALVYDFDGTLSPKPMQEYSFLPQLGVRAADFWAECSQIARKENADPLITYMHLMYKKAKEKGLRIDRKDLVAQGRDVALYPGVETWFADIGAYVKARAASPGIEIRHYLVSSGLTEIIEGTAIYKNFANVFASEYWFDAYDLPFPKRVITDTGKTQYLFRINKGREQHFESINAHMPEAERPIPFSNMIYFGDGETDVPSMALLKKNGGHAIAVHGPPSQPRNETPSPRQGGVRGQVKTKDRSHTMATAIAASQSSAATAASSPTHAGLEKCIELFHAGRCDFYAEADYRKGSALFKRTCLLLDRMIADIRIRQEASALG